MVTLRSILLVAHLIGLALGLGCATAKLALLLRSRADREFTPHYLQITRPITRFIVLGLILLTLSGIGWILLGLSITTVLAFKLILVGALWVLGPLIDNVFEPRFRKLASAAGEAASPEFLRAQRQYVAAEVTATGMFYIIVLMWVLS